MSNATATPSGSQGVKWTTSNTDIKRTKSSSSSWTNTLEGAEFDSARGGIERDLAKHEKKAKQVLRRAALAANTDRLVDRQQLLDVIHESHQRWAGCLMLPVTLLFFTFYSAAASLHEDADSNHLLEAPIRAKLAPPVDDGEDAPPGSLEAVDSISGVYDFIESTWLPLLFLQTDSSGAPLMMQDWGKLYQYNQIKSMVILEQHRSAKEPCTGEFTKHLMCYPQDSQTNEPYGLPFSEMPGATAAYYVNGTDPIIGCELDGFSVEGCTTRRLNPMLRDDLAVRMPAPSDEGFLYRFMFDPAKSFSLAMDRLQYLKDRAWLDDQSKQLVMKASYINYQFTVPRLQTIVVTFFFSRGGNVFAKLRIHAVPFHTFISSLSYVADTLFGLMLFASTVYVISSLIQAICAGKWRSHFSFVNFVTWCSVFMGWLNAVLLWSSAGWRVNLREKLETYMASPTEANAIALADYNDEITVLLGWSRLFVADAHLLFMVRCFISLKWQPRLAVVTKTMKVMSSDLFHFMIVLIPTFVAFAIAGVMMFGRRLQDFATLQAAMATCFKIAMENEFKWVELSAQDFWTAVLWVWVYLLLVVLLMLNMVLAIVMDIYQHVRRESGNTMTITRHIQYIYMNFRLRKSWIPYIKLFREIRDMPQTISVLEIRQKFPDMPDYQCNYLIAECLNKAKIITRVGEDTGVVEQMVAAIHVYLEDILSDLTDMKKRGWMGIGLEIPKANDREAVKDILTSVAMQQHWMELTQKNMTSLQAKIEGAYNPDADSALDQHSTPDES